MRNSTLPSLKRPISEGAVKKEVITRFHFKPKLTTLHLYYNNTRFSDMILYQEQKKILCHKVILASQSTYFSTLLEDNISKYNVTDIDYLEKIIPFLYGNTLIIGLGEIFDIFTICCKYNFYELKHLILKKVRKASDLKLIPYSVSKDIVEFDINNKK